VPYHPEVPARFEHQRGGLGWKATPLRPEDDRVRRRPVRTSHRRRI